MYAWIVQSREVSAMSTRVNVIIPDELKSMMDKLAKDNEISTSEIFRKAIGLYIASQQAKAEGKSIGLFDKKSREVTTEFVGL